MLYLGKAHRQLVCILMHIPLHSFMHIHCGYTILHGTLTCSGTEVVGWSSSGNESSLLFDDDRFDASKLSCPDVIQLAAKLTLIGPVPSDTKTRKRYNATEVQTHCIYCHTKISLLISSKEQPKGK